MVMRLVIGSRNRCPWSLATWLAMRMFDLPFEDVLVPLDRPETEELLERFSPSARVPVLVDGATTIWDSLAILEHLAERQPAMWPESAEERALARSIAAELHSGFPAIDRFLPVDLVARFAPPGRLMRSVSAELKRVRKIWSDRLGQTSSKKGPFLFGRFTIVDALFAPIAARFVTYALPPLDPGCAAYVTTLTELPVMREWLAEAASEVAAFARIPAPPFHRTAPEPLGSATDQIAHEDPGRLRSEPDTGKAGAVDAATKGSADDLAGPAASSRGEVIGSLDERPPASIGKPLSGPQLEAVDRPGIAYLDDPAAHSSISVRKTADLPPARSSDQGSLPLSGIAYLDEAERKVGSIGPPTRPATETPGSTPGRQSPHEARPEHSAPARPMPREPDPPATREPAPRGDPSRYTPAPAQTSAPPAVRLRRPGTPATTEGGTSTNRFARAISGGRERLGDPSEPEIARRKAEQRKEPADRVEPGAAERPRPDRTDVLADPSSPGRTIRSSAIKPIGLSTHRRR